jgi:hypothetical protein
MLHDYKDDEMHDLARVLPTFIKEHTNNIDVRFTLIELQAYLKKAMGYVPEIFKEIKKKK